MKTINDKNDPTYILNGFFINPTYSAEDVRFHYTKVMILNMTQLFKISSSIHHTTNPPKDTTVRLWWPDSGASCEQL